MNSCIQYNKICYVCGSDRNLHCHHIFFGTANRQKSDEDGMTVWLCGKHHNLSNEGVHFNKALDDKLKKIGEKFWILHYTDPKLTPEEKIEKFIARYGCTYISPEDLIPKPGTYA